jgi:anionic cell wall polymer biosynthesis LytR-Cps2A-Psr (LCP) family protein
LISPFARAILKAKNRLQEIKSVREGVQRYLKRESGHDMLTFELVVAVLIAMQFLVVLFIEKKLTGEAAEVIEAATEQEKKEESAITLTLDENKYTSDHGFETYLFVGTDDSGNEETKNQDDYHGSLADFINLLVVDNTDKTYAILAINRDTMTYVPMMQEDGTVKQLAFMQICTAHGYGSDLKNSAKNTVNTVSALLGELSIDASFVLPVDAIPTVNSLVGGVTVTIDGDLTAIDPAFKDGERITLSDEQAERFVRARMSVGEGVNTERMDRQGKYITGLKEKLLGSLSTDPTIGVSIFDKLKASATTDINGNIVSRIANAVAVYDDLGTFEFEGEFKIGQALADGLDHYEFYPDSESRIRILTELFSLEGR